MGAIGAITNGVTHRSRRTRTTIISIFRLDCLLCLYSAILLYCGNVYNGRSSRRRIFPPPWPRKRWKAIQLLALNESVSNRSSYRLESPHPQSQHRLNIYASAGAIWKMMRFASSSHPSSTSPCMYTLEAVDVWVGLNLELDYSFTHTHASSPHVIKNPWGFRLGCSGAGREDAARPKIVVRKTQSRCIIKPSRS